jgi:hypothetical protein
MIKIYKLFKNPQNIITGVYTVNSTPYMFIPFDLGNTDYQEYLKWLEEGNTPLPADNSPQENN